MVKRSDLTMNFNNDDSIGLSSKNNALRGLQKKINILQSFSKDDNGSTNNNTKNMSQLNFISSNLERSLSMDKSKFETPLSATKKNDSIINGSRDNFDGIKHKESSFFSFIPPQNQHHNKHNMINPTTGINSTPKKSKRSISYIEEAPNTIKVDQAIHRWEPKTKLNFEYIETSRLKKIYDDFLELKELNKAKVIYVILITIVK